jgi:hypothetical protein
MGGKSWAGWRTLLDDLAERVLKRLEPAIVNGAQAYKGNDGAPQVASAMRVR